MAGELMKEIHYTNDIQKWKIQPPVSNSSLAFMYNVLTLKHDVKREEMG